METITVNALAQARLVTEGGREYLVADATMVCPGVLPGSQGPLLYTEGELKKSVSAWNKIPVVVNHPIDPATGQHLSADSPGVLERSGIGFVRGAAYKDKLTAELWLDVQKTQLVDRRVLDAIRAGKALELSTGLYTRNTPAENGAVSPKGVPYTHEARDYVPDHLAVFTDGQTGACSISDGCGVLVNAADLGATREVRQSFLGWLGGVLGLTANAGVNQPRHHESGQYLPHAAGHGRGRPHVDAVASLTPATATEGATPATTANGTEYPAVCPDCGKAWPADANPKDNGGKCPNCGKVMTPVANEESDKIDPEKACQILRDGEANGHPLTDDQRRMFGAACDHKDKTTNEGQDVALTPEKRQALIAGLVANCDCWKHAGDDKLLANFSDDKLLQLEEAAGNEAKHLVVANAATSGFTDGRRSYRINPDTGQWETSLLANAAAKPGEEDDPEDLLDHGIDEGAENATAMADEKGTAGAHGKAADAHQKAADHYQAKGNMKLASMHQAKADEHTQAAGKLTGNQKEGQAVKPQTMDEWLKGIPDDAKPVWNSMVKALNQEREGLIARLVANVSDEAQKKAIGAVYGKMGIDELRTVAAAVPLPAGARPDDGLLMPNYVGAAGAFVSNREDDLEPLNMPQMDFSRAS